MKITILLLCVILLAGCSPDAAVNNVEADYKSLKENYVALQSDFSKLQQRTDDYKEELADLRGQHNKLIADYANLINQYAVLEVYYTSINNQYNNLYAEFSLRWIGDDKTLAELNNQYQAVIERQRELDEQLEAVHSKKVALLSDNLTESEYSAFYKGWELWWESFNNEEGEE